MSNFAKINKESIVEEVFVVLNKTEKQSISWLRKSFGGSWVAIPDDAGIGYTYDSERKSFIAPQPHESWTLNPDTLKWVPPVPEPKDEKSYSWDEETTSWVEVAIETE